MVFVFFLRPPDAAAAAAAVGVDVDDVAVDDAAPSTSLR